MINIFKLETIANIWNNIEFMFQDVLREKQTQLQRLMTELELEKEVNSSQSILHKKNMDEVCIFS